MNSPITKPTLEDWALLFQEALKYKEQKPWDYFSDSELIAIEDPIAQITCYCSIFGAAGELFGVGAYLGRNGLAGFLDISEQRVDPSEILAAQDCLMLSFEDREFLSKEDLHLIKQLGLKFRGKSNYPQVLRHEPGFEAMLIQSQVEVQLFTRVLTQLNAAIPLVKNIKLSPSSVIFEEEILYWFCEKDIWKGEIRPLGERPERRLFTMNPMTVDDITLHRMKKYPKSTSRIEFDFFMSISPIREPKHRAYYPFLFLMVDHHSGMILGVEIAAGHEALSEALKKIILAHLNNTKSIPQALLVSNAQLFKALTPLSKLLGIAVQKVDYLEELTPVKENLLTQMMAGPSF